MKRLSIFLLLIFLAFSLQAQNLPIYTGLSSEEQLSFIGMMMADLLERFGPPRSVIVERGIEVWQDDVVFQYNGIDFYIFRDRIWQIKIASTHGISNGDRKATVLQALGRNAEDRGDHIVLPITGRNWPISIRVNLNNSGIVTAIYIYRSNF